MKKIVAAAFAASVTAVASQEWTVWPCYGGGYVQNVVIAPSNPRVWYAYVDVGGPYRSDDAGRHWRPLHGNLAGIHRNVSGDCVRRFCGDIGFVGTDPSTDTYQLTFSRVTIVLC